MSAFTGSSPMKHGKRQHGFSLFELVVYLLVSSILFATIVNRYRDFPAEAERANFLAVLAQLKAGVNLQMINAIARDRWSDLSSLDASNPMDLMLEVPSNYLGEFELADPSSMPGRTWYFDTTTGELVYRAENARNLVLVQQDGLLETDHIRFRIENVFSDGDSGDWQGIVLAPSTAYEWERTPIEYQVAAE